jgi:hypothetical protein
LPIPEIKESRFEGRNWCQVRVGELSHYCCDHLDG